MTLISFLELLSEEQADEQFQNMGNEPRLHNQANIEIAVHNILTNIGENPQREGLLKTPNRVARMFGELTSGYDVDPVKLINGAIFTVDYDEMVVVKDIDFYSMCEQHMLPFYGRVHVAYIPDGKVVGLSKIPRIIEMFARRLQIQEHSDLRQRRALQAAIVVVAGH